MSPYSILRALDAARLVVDDLQVYLDQSAGKIPGAAHLREAALAIPANIQEGLGKETAKERIRYFRIAVGTAEETTERLRAAHAASYIDDMVFWRIRNRLIILVRMLRSLILNAKNFRTP